MSGFYTTKKEINGKMVTVVLDPGHPDIPGDKPDYNEMAKAELIVLAKSKGIELRGRMTKATIIALLEGAS